MKIWQRHSLFAVPFVVAAVVLRRAAEALRLIYWRRVFGWRIGRDVRVHWSVHIPRKFVVRLRDGVNIARWVQVNTDTVSGVLEIGANTSVAQSCSLDVSGELKIGANVTISEGVSIYTHSHGRTPKTRPTGHTLTIGDGAWICTRALIFASTRSIGARAIIGPNEVVRSPVAEDCLYIRRCPCDGRSVAAAVQHVCCTDAAGKIPLT